MIKGDTSEAIQFLQAWTPEGLWQLTAIVPDGKITTVTFQPGPERNKAARAWIDDRQGRENMYFTVNPVLRPMNIKPKKADMRGMAALHVDIDPRPGEEMEAERNRALKLLREFKPAPTVIIDSGGGFQGFWLLDEEQRTDGSEDRAAELEAAPWLSANTLAPRASGLVKASAWMLTNRSACTRRAFCTRVARGTK